MTRSRADRLLRWAVVGALFVASAAVWWHAHAQRIKEVASVQGVRSNPLGNVRSGAVSAP